MRLSARIVSLLCVASIVLPISAHAATTRTIVTKTLKLSDVIAISAKSNKSTSFQFSIEGQSGKTSIELEVQGTQKGNPTSVRQLAGDMTFSATVRMEDASTATVKGRLIVVDSMMYVSIEHFDTDNDFLMIYGSMIEEYIGTWFSVPLDESDFDENTRQSTENAKLLRSLDPYFTVNKTTTRDGATYVVTIPKAKQRALVRKFIGSATALPSYASTQVRAFSSSSIDMTLTMKTVRDLFESLDARIAVTSKTRGSTEKTTVTGSAKVLRSAPVITAPSASVPLDTLFNSSEESDESTSRDL